MRRFVIAATLACALSVTALAGEIPSTGAPAPECGITQCPTEGGITQGPGIATTIVLTVLSLIR